MHFSCFLCNRIIFCLLFFLSLLAWALYGLTPRRLGEMKGRLKRWWRRGEREMTERWKRDEREMKERWKRNKIEWRTHSQTHDQFVTLINFQWKIYCCESTWNRLFYFLEQNGEKQNHLLIQIKYIGLYIFIFSNDTLIAFDWRIVMA